MKSIEEKIENRKIKSDVREYLGLSQIGNPCERELWYDFRFASKFQVFTPREIRLFGRGHMEELVVIEDLIKAGVKVSGIGVDDSTRARFKTIFGLKIKKSDQERVTFAHGHGSGHNDGKLTNVPQFKIGEDLLFECKTSKTKHFIALQNSQDLKKTKFQHFVQCQTYMLKFGFDFCLYVMVNKEDDQRIYLYITLDKKFAQSQINRATDIIFMDRPPQRIGDRNYYRCRPFTCKIEKKEKLFCQHRDVCHNDKRMQKTCRTCRFVEIHNKGRWKCSKKECFLDLKKQLKGCKKYKVMQWT